jgi:hypothetical protein
MDCTEPEILDRRLGNQQWIVHAADVNYFDHLASRVRTLMRGTDNFELPDINGAFAWKRLYAIWVSLKQRESNERAEMAAQREAQAPDVSRWRWADHEWERYVQNLAALQEVTSRSDWPMLKEYLRIEDDDLSDPVPSPDSPYACYGRMPHWQRTASRVSWALAKIRNMSADESMRIPAVLHQRAQEARMKALEQRLAAMESSPAAQKEDVENGR